MIDQEEFELINQLRFQAFRTNKSQDVENYYKAASSWFQGELAREIKRSHEIAAEITQLRAELASLSAENERLREALREVARDPREESTCIGDGWAFYEDAMNYAKEALK